MDTICELFGRRVRELREASGVSQDAFAHAAGLGRAYYGRVERGEINVSLVTVARIAEGLGVAVVELFAFPRGKKARG